MSDTQILTAGRVGDTFHFALDGDWWVGHRSQDWLKPREVTRKLVTPAAVLVALILSS
jgi:hypothetical protein